MIVAIGIDLVEVARVRRVRARHPARFDARVFTAGELAYCGAQADPAIHLAGRFAAKEAILKVLGTGWGREVAWQEVEVARAASGAVEARLHGAAEVAARARGIAKLWISLTHTAEHAMAVAIGEA
ncbi:MAG: holo-ACP synthase [Planctomycetes bacterium]|nr:holo-ACP synthase [Planctomycetota bacterium]